MIIISTIIVALMSGIFSTPYLFSVDSGLLAQISQNKKISEIDPLQSLGNVTGPLDAIWQGLGRTLNIDASKSPLEGRLSLEGISGSPDKWQAFGIVKSAFILIANILVAVLEIVLWLLKGLLGLIS